MTVKKIRKVSKLTNDTKTKLGYAVEALEYACDALGSIDPADYDKLLTAVRNKPLDAATAYPMSTIQNIIGHFQRRMK